MLLKCHIKVDAKNELNKTPIHLAAEQGHDELVVHNFSMVMHGYCSYLAILYVDLAILPVLPLSYFFPSSPRVVGLVLKHQHDTILDEDEDSNTPLHLACTQGHLGVAKILVDQDANVEAR